MEVPKTVNKRLAIAAVLFIVFFGISWRLMPHLPNFAPIGAIALAAGMALGWRKSLLVTLAIVGVSDLVIGFYPGMQWTWLSYGLVAGIGQLVRSLPLAWRVPVGVLGTSSLFFLVSNFGTWIASGMYSLDVSGLLQCYFMALPFLRATLLSDLFFATVFLTAYEVFLQSRPRTTGSRYRLILNVSSWFSHGQTDRFHSTAGSTRPSSGLMLV